jgi:hypothetical protein
MENGLELEPGGSEVRLNWRAEATERSLSSVGGRLKRRTELEDGSKGAAVKIFSNAGKRNSTGIEI